MKINKMEAKEFYSLLKTLIRDRIIDLTKDFRAYESANKLGRLEACEKKAFKNTVKVLEINEDYAKHYDRKYTRLQ